MNFENSNAKIIKKITHCIIFFYLESKITKNSFIFAVKNKILQMNLFITTNEGHQLCIEESIFYIKWKVNDLKNQNVPEAKIIYWEDDEIWYHYAKIFIELLNNKSQK